MASYEPDNAASSVREVVVFDLDGTLVAGDSFGAFLRRLLTGHPLRLTGAVVAAAVWLPALLVPRARRLAERGLVWLATVGIQDDGFVAAARSFAVEHAGPAGGRAAAAAIARLREHVDLQLDAEELWKRPSEGGEGGECIRGVTVPAFLRACPRPQAPPAGRHRRVAAGPGGALGERAGPGRRPTGAHRCAPGVGDLRPLGGPGRRTPLRSPGS